MRRVAAALLTSGAIALLSAAPASAHAEPTTVSPAACSTVASAGEVVVNLSLEADAERSSISASVDGVVVATAGVDLDDINHQRMVVALPDGISGRVDVSWVTFGAADGDQDSGTFAFAVGSDAELTDCGLGADAEPSSGVSVVLVTLIAGSSLAALALVRNRRHVAPTSS